MRYVYSAGICLMLTTGNAMAGELRHEFVNPNFGGNPFNASPLLANASAQNKYKDPGVTSNQKTSAQQFAENLDRQVLSRLSRLLINQAFGEDGVLEGTLSTDIHDISIEETGDSTIVTVVNPQTGETTTVEIPAFN